MITVRDSIVDKLMLNITLCRVSPRHRFYAGAVSLYE